MKQALYLSLILLITTSASAQLKNTKWKATLNFGSPVNVVFNFGSDTLKVLMAEDNSVVEASNYFLNDTVLTMQKLYGQSGCDTAAKGIYSITINGNNMQMKLMSDDCYDRPQYIKDLMLTKLE